MKVTTPGQSTYTIPVTGVYKIVCMGAGGGAQSVSNKTYSSDTHGTITCGGGKGGKTTYYAELTAGTTLYLCVGGTGTTTAGGYNGGGNPGQGKTGKESSTGETYILAYGGGGATHVALKSGLLKSFSAKNANLLCVAGGGGGSGGSGGPKNEYNAVSIANGVGGNGGGSSGGTSTCSADYGSKLSSGGTQSAAGSNSWDSSDTQGSFGLGGNGFGYNKTDNYWDNYGDPYEKSKSSATNCGGGGGGYYGGGGGSGYIWSQAGGGGSGYVKTSTTASYYATQTYSNTTSAGSGSSPTKDGSIEITLQECPVPMINDYAYNTFYLRWNIPLVDAGGSFGISLEASNDKNFTTKTVYTYSTTQASLNIYSFNLYQQYKYVRYKILGYNSSGTNTFTSEYSNICELFNLDDPLISKEFYSKAKQIIDSNYKYFLETSPSSYSSPTSYALLKKDDFSSLLNTFNTYMGTNINFNDVKPLNIDKQSLLYYL